MSKEELEKAIAEKQELVRKLEVYQMTKGHTLPTGKDVNQSIIALQNQIKEHEYNLEYSGVMSDDEVLAIARGEMYFTEDEKKQIDEGRKYIKGLLDESDEDAIKEIREMIKAGR